MKPGSANMAFKEYRQGMDCLFPAGPDEFIPKNSPVRLVNRIVDRLDTTPVLQTHEGGGTGSCYPRMLLKVIFCAYMNNICSCRRTEKALQENIYYMYLSGKQFPPYSTINRYRSGRLKECINSLFVQAVTMPVEMGQISLEVQHADGTKMEPVAGKYTFAWRKNVERNRAKLQDQTASILSQIEEGIAGDSQPLMEDTPSPIDSNTLKARMETVNGQNREKGREEGKLLKELEKLAEHEARLDISGNRNSYSGTDESATFMRMKEDAMNSGQTKPGYSIQAGTENQHVTNFGLYPNPGDTTTLSSFLTLHQARFGSLPERLCADAGYGSEENYELMERLGIEAFVKYAGFHKEQKRGFTESPFLQENLYYNEKNNCFVCPMGQHMVYSGVRYKVGSSGYAGKLSLYRACNCRGCPLRGECHHAEGERIIQVNHNLRRHRQAVRERLTSEEGIKHRKRRCIEPEAVFGQIKFDRQYKRFRHRGFDRVTMDFGVPVMAFNIQKLWNRTAKRPFYSIFRNSYERLLLFITLSKLQHAHKSNQSVYAMKNAA